MFNNIYNKLILSNHNIEEILANILPDSIIADTNYKILDISDSVVDLLGYQKSQLVGKYITDILFNNSLNLMLLLNNQYYIHNEFSLKDVHNQEIKVFLSGYFLGLLSDINGKIVILVKNRKNFISDKKIFDRRRLELNELIYRMSHDVRGPLATIKGLALTAQHESDPSKIQEYFTLINQVSDKLDLTFQCLWGAFNQKNFQCSFVDMKELLNSISERIDKFKSAYRLKLDLTIKEAPDDFIFFSNQFLSSIIIENLIQIIESFRESKDDYNINMEYDSFELRITLTSRNIGTVISKFLLEKIEYKTAKQLITRNEYNYVNYRLVKICMDVIKANIKLGNDDQILIRIPSQVYID